MPCEYIQVPNPAPVPGQPNGPMGSTPLEDTWSNQHDLGQWVTNPSPAAQFTLAYTTPGCHITNLQDSAPSTVDHTTNAPIKICLSYHSRGSMLHQLSACIHSSQSLCTQTLVYEGIHHTTPAPLATWQGWTCIPATLAPAPTPGCS